MNHTPSANEVETYTGRYVDTRAPQASTITLEDVAHALANTCRYGGHCQRFYSVAEHAVFCSVRVQRQGHSRRVQLAALHHDDAEAYLGDIPRPLKPLLGAAYARLTQKMDRAIETALDLPTQPHSRAVKDADNWALFVEARHLLPSQGKHWFDGDQGAHAWGLGDQPGRIVIPEYWLDGLEPAAAEHLFITRHEELTA